MFKRAPLRRGAMLLVLLATAASAACTGGQLGPTAPLDDEMPDLRGEVGLVIGLHPLR